VSNPYFIEEPAVISFSGGRTSGMMLYKILEAHGGTLPDYIKVCFANTGKEMPQTLDFVRDCGERWGVDIVWLERWARLSKEDEKNKFTYETKVTSYKDAARNGEPFAGLIKVKRYAPNPVARFCTVELKIRAISEYLVDCCGFEKPYTGCIGIRADEEIRAEKMNGTVESGQERYLPLWEDGVTKMDVYNFWNDQEFDLDLPNNKGVTDWGNCDLCFLKGHSKKMSIIRSRPDLADWWVAQESELSELSELVGKGAFFRADQPTYAQMKANASDQLSLFEYDNESISCFCGD